MLQSRSHLRQKNNKTVKKPHVNINIQSTNQGISLEELKKLAKKYSVLSSGKSKSQLALLIYKIRSQSMSTFDLEKIVYLLPSKEKRKIKQMISKQYENPVTEYKGMWKPMPKALNKMSRIELIHNLRNFRDAWEREIGRNQDLSDERLAGETDKTLRQRLSWYYSEAANWIRDNI